MSIFSNDYCVFIWMEIYFAILGRFDNLINQTIEGVHTRANSWDEGSPVGLVDHCEFYNIRVIVTGNASLMANKIWAQPFYQWNNTHEGEPIEVFVHNNCGIHIKENRDYYNNTEKHDYTPFSYPYPLTEFWDSNLYTNS